MRLSTSINIMDAVLGKFGVISAEECMLRCKNAGFNVLDFNFYDQEREGMPMNRDDWREWLCDIKIYADQLGIEFSQTHPNFFNIFDLSDSNNEWNNEKVRRGIIGSGILGAKWAVFHVGTIFNDNNEQNDEKSLQANIDYLKPLVQLAKENKTGIAIENLGPDSFARNSDNLIKLVDALDSTSIGICWDFGHAQICGLNQRESLLKIGNRLKATHVSDTHGLVDEHIPPFFGIVDWPLMMKTLKDIYYKGDFTYEIQNITRTLPEAGRDTLLRYFVELGEYLLTI